MEKEENPIYKMKLHDKISITVGQEKHTIYLRIVRVAGGWIYCYDNSVTFVPYNNEFMEGVTWAR